MAMARFLPLALLALLAACDPGGGQAGPALSPTAAPASPSPTAPAGTPIAAVGDLVGEYRLAAIDGEDFNRGYGIAISIDGPMLSFEPVCAGFVWRIALEDGVLQTERANLVEQVPGQGPPPVCAVGIPPEQRQLAEALDAATSAVRTPSNGVLLAGGGRSVLLFSQ